MRTNFSLLILLFCFSAAAKLEILTTTTEIAWLVEQIAKDKANVTSLLNGTENPHYLDTNPSFIIKAVRADMVCLNGMDLEIGWMPRILQKAGNAKLQKDQPGYCDASVNVDRLEVQKAEDITRAQGDVHPGGNPHYTMSAAEMIHAAGAIAEHLSAMDSASSGDYLKNLNSLNSRLKHALEGAQKQFAALTNRNVIQYHKEFTYLFRDLGLNNVDTIEKTPGVAPSALRLAQVASRAKELNVQLFLSTDQYPQQHLEKISEMSGIAFLILPGHLKKGQDYLEFFQNMIEKLKVKLHVPAS